MFLSYQEWSACLSVTGGRSFRSANDDSRHQTEADQCFERTHQSHGMQQQTNLIFNVIPLRLTKLAVLQEETKEAITGTEDWKTAETIADQANKLLHA